MYYHLYHNNILPLFCAGTIIHIIFLKFLNKEYKEHEIFHVSFHVSFKVFFMIKTSKFLQLPRNDFFYKLIPFSISLSQPQYNCTRLKKRPGYPVFTLEWLINSAHLYHTVSRREFKFSRYMAIRRRTTPKHHLHHQPVGKYIV